MAVVGTFNSRPEAELAAAMLANDGVQATVLGDDAGGTAGINLASGGYQLEVPDAQCAEAEALLQPVTEDEPLQLEPDRYRRPPGLRIAAFLVLAIVVIAVLWSLLD